MDRFSRTRLLLGNQALDKLKSARVAIFGLGAVGSYACEALARSGVGYFRLIDFDVVRESNFNRQLLALTSNLGKKKIEAARDRILDINPECVVDTHETFADAGTCPDLLAKPLDAALDAIDSLTPKVALISELVRSGIPFISSMGAATRIDPLSVRIGDITEITNDPLARFTRKRLRKTGIAGGVKCVYSIEPAREMAAMPEDESEYFERGRKRKPLGSLSCVTGIFGLTAASEIIKTILGPRGSDNPFPI
jgi:tRNA A37 threonylcarbamoyladenosine dehydratase